MFSVLILLIIAGKMNLPTPYLVAIYILGGITIVIDALSLARNTFKIATTVKPAIGELKEALRNRSER